jgi:hypothetical protein
MQVVMEQFRHWCGLPCVQGAIDNTHISITKPIEPYAKDYYYLKTRKYSMVLQVVVEFNKRFTNIYVGLPRSVNDSHVLKLLSMYKKIKYGGLLDMDKGTCIDIPSYILGDKGYPLILKL